jgi:hypothetical protein
MHRSSRWGWTIIALAGALGACQDAAVEPRARNAGPSLSIASEPTTSFTVTGFTYGPNGELVTPPTCHAQESISVDSVYWTNPAENPGWGPGGYRTLDSIFVGIELNSETSCGIGYDPGGQAATGADVAVYVTLNGERKFLGRTPAAFDRELDVTDVPVSGTLEFVVEPYPGCAFLDWVFDGDQQNRGYSNPYTVSASAVHEVVNAQIRCNTGSGNPPADPPPGPPDTCLDPNTPGCTPNGTE